MENNTELMFSTDDPHVDELVTELVSDTVSRDRSEQILKDLSTITLSLFQKKQVLGSIQLHWYNAARQAKQQGLFSDQPTSEPIVDQIYHVYQLHVGREFDIK